MRRAASAPAASRALRPAPRAARGCRRRSRPRSSAGWRRARRGVAWHRRILAGPPPLATMPRLVESMRVMMLAQSFAPIVGGEERVVEDLSRGAGRPRARRRDRDPAAARRRDSRRDGGGRPGPRPAQHQLPDHAASTRTPSAATRPPPRTPRPSSTCGGCCAAERPDRSSTPTTGSSTPTCRSTGGLPQRPRPLAARLRPDLRDQAPAAQGRRLLRARRRSSARSAPASTTASAKGLVAACRRPLASGRGCGGTSTSSSRSARPSSELCRICGDEDSQVIPNFIGALPRPPCTTTAPGPAPDEPFILFFGDITVDKGAWHLAEAYARLESPPPLVLDRPLLPRRAAERPGVARRSAPWPHELVIEALRRSMFTVAPSIWPEPFGLVALEAAAAGKAVIASEHRRAARHRRRRRDRAARPARRPRGARSRRCGG